MSELSKGSNIIKEVQEAATLTSEERPYPLSPERGARMALVSAVSLAALYLLAGYLPATEFTILLTTLLALPITLLFAVGTVSALANTRTLVLHTVVSCALFLFPAFLAILARVVAIPKLLMWLILPYQILRHYAPWAAILLFIWCACCMGHWLSRLVKERKLLLPISVVLALVDLFTVFGGGVVTQAVHAPKGHATLARAAMQTLTANLPAVGVQRGATPMQLAIGFADFLFVAFFFACFQRLGMSPQAYKITIVALLTVLTVYLSAVFLFAVDLPALVPIAVVVIGVNWRAFRYSRSELFALLYAGVAILLLLGLAVYLTHKG